MTPRWIHASFALVWLSTAIAFFLLAKDAYESESIRLVQITDRVSEGHILLDSGAVGMDPEHVMNIILDATNQNAQKLEDSIHQTAKLSFYLNLLSGIFACVGLAAQIGAYLHEQHEHSKRKHRHQPLI